MAHLNITERYDFQQWIIKDLEAENGFIHRPQSSYNQRLAMDTDVLWDFLLTTQEEEMEYLLKKLGKEVILNLINQEIIKGGFLFALKSGVYIENKRLKLMYLLMKKRPRDTKITALLSWRKSTIRMRTGLIWLFF
jgi:type I restriction enzyme R subunit